MYSAQTPPHTLPGPCAEISVHFLPAEQNSPLYTEARPSARKPALEADARAASMGTPRLSAQGRTSLRAD